MPERRFLGLLAFLSIVVPGSLAAQVFTLSPTSLTFSANQNDAPSSQSVSLSLLGGGTFTYSTSTDVPWLTVSPGGKVASQATIAVTESPSGLNPGAYSGHVFVSPGGTVNVALLVSGSAPPMYTLSPTALNFSSNQSDPPSSQFVSLALQGGGTFTYSTSTDVPWLTVSPGGKVASQATITVTESPSGLSPGNYSGHIFVSPGGTVNVALQVSGPAPPNFNVTPSVSGSTTTSSPTTLTQQITLSNSGGASGFTATITGFVNGLPSGFSISPSSGSVSGGGSTNLTVSFNSAGMAPGTYTAQYTITSTGGATTARGAAVETVNGTLVISSGSLSLSLPNTLSQSFTVADAGPGALPMPISVAYSSNDNKASVSLTPASSTTASITASVSSSALPAGATSSGFIVVTCTAPCTNSPQHIPVTITGPSSPSGNPFSASPVSATTQTTSGALIPLTGTVSNSGTATNFTASLTLSSGFTLISSSGTCALSAPGGTMSNPGTANVQLQFNPAGISPGTYTATYTADSRSCGGTGVAQAVATVTVQGTLVISANMLSITLPNTSSQAFTISDAGPGALPMPISVGYSSNDNKVPVMVTSVSSTTASVTASVLPGALSSGATSTGYVVVTCSQPCTNSPQNIPVTVNGPSAPTTTTLMVSPPSLSFPYQTGGSSPSPQSLSITSNPSTAFTVQSNSPWLFATPLGGSTSASSSVSVSIDPTQLPAGNNSPQGYLTISCNTASACTNGPISVQVNVSITAPTDVFSLDTLSLSFGGSASVPVALERRAGSSSSKTVTLTNNTNNILAVGVTANSTGGWLSASIAPNQVLAKGTASITVTADPSSLAPSPNPYTGSVSVTGGGLTKTINVMLTVPGSPVTQSTKIISQIADGGPWQTTIVVVNRGPNAATAGLNFSWR